VEECQIEAGFRLRWRTEGRCGSAAGKTGSARRVQKEAAMGIERGGFCRMDDNFRRRVPVGHIYDTRAIFSSQARILAQKGSTLSFFFRADPPPPVAAVGAKCD
jgi:hypothetical protein